MSGSAGEALGPSATRARRAAGAAGAASATAAPAPAAPLASGWAHPGWRIVGIVGFAALTAVGAQLSLPVPGTAVPITAQTLFVLLAGAVLGPWAGAGAMALYLGLGVAGVPVFVGGGGFARLIGPTGGYLIAFPAAAFLVGWAVSARRGWTGLIAGFALGTVAVFAGGLGQLALLTARPWSEVFALGLLPFLPGAVLKAAVGVIVVRLLERKVDR